MRPQPVIRGWIVGFYGFAARLLIDVDGDVHDMQRAEDERRTHVPPLEGLEVLRVRNKDALADVPDPVAGIVEAILQPRGQNRA